MPLARSTSLLLFLHVVLLHVPVNAGTTTIPVSADESLIQLTGSGVWEDYTVYPPVGIPEEPLYVVQSSLPEAQLRTVLNFPAPTTIPAGEYIVSARIECQFVGSAGPAIRVPMLRATGFSATTPISGSDADVVGIDLGASLIYEQPEGFDWTDETTYYLLEELTGVTMSIPLDPVGLTALIENNVANADLRIRLQGAEVVTDVPGEGFAMYSLESTVEGALPAQLVIETAPIPGSTIVEMDVVLSSNANRINLPSGLFTVGLLSSETFDASTVDVGSLGLGDPDLTTVPNATGALTSPGLALVVDVNGDGLDDLWMLYNSANLYQNGGVDSFTSEFILQGETISGDVFEATDNVRINSRGRGPRRFIRFLLGRLNSIWQYRP